MPGERISAQFVNLSKMVSLVFQITMIKGEDFRDQSIPRITYNGPTLTLLYIMSFLMP